MAGFFWTDTSYYNKGLSAAYPHPFACWRIADGTFVDPLAKSNRDAARLLIGKGQMVGHMGYYVPRPSSTSTDAALQVIQSVVGKPDSYFALMQDVESWDGKIVGDHSTYFNDLHNKVANWLGNRKRVIGYANGNDYYTLWQRPPADLRIIGAGYGINPQLPGQIGWQYSDGDPRWSVPAGWPRSTPSLGAVDQNYSDLTPAQFAAALGLGVATPPPPPPPSIEEEIMSFYKDKAEFEAALRQQASDGVWGPGKNARFWLWRTILAVVARHASAEFGPDLLTAYKIDPVTKKRVVDDAITKAHQAQFANLFNESDPVKLLQALSVKLNAGDKPPTVIYVRPGVSHRCFLPVNDGAERRWVSAAEVATWPNGYRAQPLPENDPFWSIPSLTANAETEADRVEALDAAQDRPVTGV